MEEFAEKRLAICKTCPMMRMTELGMRCDDRKWFNPITNKASFFKCEGCKKGCGCYLVSKTRNKSNKCPVGKW